MEYKKKHRPLKVELLDGTIKTFLIDESDVTSLVNDRICSELGVKCPEEFSLKALDNNTHQWLNPNLALPEQGIQQDQILQLRKKFFYNDASIDISPVEKAQREKDGVTFQGNTVTYFNTTSKGAKTQEKLLGVTSKSVIQVDPITKQVLKEYPLTSLKRWAPSSKSLTLDFGDYEDDYLSLGTTAGEEISQLLSGYIDIVLKARREAGRVIEDDEGQIAEEEVIHPVRGLIPNTTITPTYQNPNTNNNNNNDNVERSSASALQTSMEAQIEILKLEKNLEEARKKLTTTRTRAYNAATSRSSSSSIHTSSTAPTSAEKRATKPFDSADYKKEKSNSEENRKTFNITNGFTPEEEEQVRKQNEWHNDDEKDAACRQEQEETEAERVRGERFYETSMEGVVQKKKDEEDKLIMKLHREELEKERTQRVEGRGSVSAPKVGRNTSDSSGSSDKSSLFAVINNSGTGMTSGLRKVQADMKSKNRSPKEQTLEKKACKKSYSKIALGSEDIAIEQERQRMRKIYGGDQAIEIDNLIMNEFIELGGKPDILIQKIKAAGDLNHFIQNTIVKNQNLTELNEVLGERIILKLEEKIRMYGIRSLGIQYYSEFLAMFVDCLILVYLQVCVTGINEDYQHVITQARKHIQLYENKLESVLRQLNITNLVTEIEQWWKDECKTTKLVEGGSMSLGEELGNSFRKQGEQVKGKENQVFGGGRIEGVRELAQTVYKPNSVQKCIEASYCTFIVTGEEYSQQTWWNCKTCGLVDGTGCCETCVDKCHEGHDVVGGKVGSFYCDCPSSGNCLCCDFGGGF